MFFIKDIKDNFVKSFLFVDFHCCVNNVYSMLQSYPQILMKYILFSLSALILLFSFTSGFAEAKMLEPNNAVCHPVVTDYLGEGLDNNPAKVRLLQGFLKGVAEKDVAVTGVFDVETREAVKSFQRDYADDILAPWGLSEEDATGYVYFTTRRVINEVYCGRGFELAPFQLAEMRGEVKGTTTVVDVSKEVSLTEEKDEEGVAVPVITQEGSDTHDLGMNDVGKMLLFIVGILAVIYVIGSIVVEMQNSAEDQKERRIQKLTYFIGGIVIATIIVSLFDMYNIVMPLIVVGIVLAIVLRVYIGKE